MATWITPVTNRTGGNARMTTVDMNRITGNLVWLYDECVRKGITIEGSAYSKTTWISNDIISESEWYELLACLRNIRTAVGYAPIKVPGYGMVWDNINRIEEHELTLYLILQTWDIRDRLNHYVGDKLTSAYLYAGDAFNAGGSYE